MKKLHTIDFFIKIIYIYGGGFLVFLKKKLNKFLKNAVYIQHI